MAIPEPKPTIDTCNACGKLFPRVSMRLCTACGFIEENRFQLVRDYVVDNDGAPIGEVARATGVSAADVRRFTDGGRLVETATGMDQCSCGGIGERCRYCRSQLSTTFREMEQSMRREHQQDEDSASRTSYVRRMRRVAE